MLQQVTDEVLLHQSELLQNNTVVVQGTDGVLLVDPGITDAEMTCLANDLRAYGHPVTAGFATHPDWDHALWHPELGEAPRYGTARCAQFLDDLLSHTDWKTQLAEGLPPEIAEETPLDLFGRITSLPAGTTRLPWAGPELRVIEHPAHAPGHAALLLEQSGVLIAGDMLSDVLIPMLDHSTDPVEDYLVGLGRLEDMTDAVDIVIPGHGSVATGDEVRSRFDRDRAYIHALRAGLTPKDDPRLGTSAKPGWEWVNDIHEGQAESVARRHGAGDTSG